MEPFELVISQEEAVEVVKSMSRGKALGTDYFPDDVYSREQLATWVRDFIPEMCRNYYPHMYKVRGVLLSKTSETRPKPRQTRLLAINTYAMKIIDKLAYKRIRDKALSTIGEY